MNDKISHFEIQSNLNRASMETKVIIFSFTAQTSNCTAERLVHQTLSMAVLCPDTILSTVHRAPL